MISMFLLYHIFTIFLSLILYINFETYEKVYSNLYRPQSAKNGGKAAWGQISNEGMSDQENNDNPNRNQRKKLKIIRPDFVTNDFARVLPKKIYQDKERLYS